MLDFSKIDFNNIGQNALNIQPKQLKLIEILIEYLNSTTASKLQKTVEEAGEKSIYYPLEDPSKTYIVEGSKKLPYTATGTDGSQILPDRHENLLCFLLNIGIAIIEYGSKAYARLKNNPTVHFKSEDLYVQISLIEGGSRQFLAPRWYIDGLRDSKEIHCLKEQLQLVKEKLENENRNHPIIGFIDGNLIRWQVQEIFKKRDIVNERLVELLDFSKKVEIPIFGYISKSRSRDIIQLLDWNYEREFIESLTIDGEGDLDLVNDVDLFNCILAKPNTRSAIFRNQKPVIKGSNQFLAFCYINTGKEIIRIEFPEWIAENHTFSKYFPYILDQIQKGMGYPVVLQEAHHQAEVSNKERDVFYNHLQETLVRAGITVKTSSKLISKKVRFV
ncbi:MAG: DNA double-strand break repair nuclease NurA [Candidatus Hodarchaeales archaeon]